MPLHLFPGVATSFVFAAGMDGTAGKAMSGVICVGMTASEQVENYTLLAQAEEQDLGFLGQSQPSLGDAALGDHWKALLAGERLGHGFSLGSQQKTCCPCS